MVGVAEEPAEEPAGDEVLAPELVDDVEALLLRPHSPLEPEPELQHESQVEAQQRLDVVAPLPGAISPKEVGQLSVMAQRSAVVPRARVAARRSAAEAAEDATSTSEQLAERHVFSNVRYAQTVAAKRRARNRTEGDFMRDARRDSFRVAAMRTTSADTRAALTGHHSTAHVVAAGLMEHAATESERNVRQVALDRHQSRTLYSEKVAAKRAASGLDEGAFARKTRLAQLIKDCPVPGRMSEESLRLELDLRDFACSYMNVEQLVAEVTAAREQENRATLVNLDGSTGFLSPRTMPSIGRKLQYGVLSDVITPPEERANGCLPIDGIEVDVPADGGILTGTRLPRDTISWSKLDRRKDKQKLAAVDDSLVGIAKKRRAAVVVSLLPHGCWFPQSGEPVKLFVDISSMVRPRNAAEHHTGYSVIVCALRKDDAQDKWCTLIETEKLSISPAGVARLELHRLGDIALIVVHVNERQACARMLAQTVSGSRRNRQRLFNGVEAEAHGLVGIRTDPAEGGPSERGYKISAVAVARCSYTQQGELCLSNDCEEAERVARAIAYEKRWLKQPAAQPNMKRRHCCKFLRRIDFISAPADQIDVRYRVPTRIVDYNAGGIFVDDIDLDDDADVANRHDVKLKGEKAKCHKLVMQISHGENILDILFAGFAVIYTATCFAAVAATHLTKVAIALLTIVPGGFLLVAVQRKFLDHYGKVLKSTVTDPAARKRFWPAIYFLWGYSIIFLTLIPMVMMAPDVGTMDVGTTNNTESEDVPMRQVLLRLDHQPFWGTLGFLFYGGAQWSIGWIFLWWYWEFTGVLTVTRSQRSHLPIGFGPKIQVFATIYECYTYSGFSFFQAIPWSIVAVPKGGMGFSLPPPHHIMQVGMFEFGGTTPFWLFVTACNTVFCSFLLLVATVRRPTRHTIVVQFFFDLLAFPMIKQLTSVFACTSAGMIVHGERFCKLEARFMEVKGAQCMDIDPTTMCWGGVGRPGDWGHLLYVLLVMTLLIPYYCLSLKTLLAAAARTSVVAKDARWTIIAFQSKVLLAFLSTAYGDCHPRLILSSVFVVVCSQLLYSRLSGRDKIERINKITDDESKVRALLELLDSEKMQADKFVSSWPRVWKETIDDIRGRQGACPSRDSLDVKRQKIATLQELLQTIYEEVIDEHLMQADTSEPEDLVDARLQKLTLKVDIVRLRQIASQVSYPQPYSSVLSINCIHQTGLWMAFFNCAFAVFVVLYGEYYGQMNRCFDYGTNITSVSTDLDAAILSHYVYWVWLGLNVGMVLSGYAWFRINSRNWRVGVEFSSLAAVNKQPYNYQVDYSIVQSRVDSAEHVLRNHENNQPLSASEIVVEYSDRDLILEFYEPGSAFGHVLKHVLYASTADRGRALVPGHRLVAVQGVKVIGETLDSVKQRLAAIATSGTVRLTFTPPIIYRVISKCVLYESIDEYKGTESGRLRLRATADQLKLQKQVCVIGHHKSRSSFVEINEGMSGNEQTTDGQTYIRVAHSSPADGDATSYWVRLSDDHGVDILRHEDADFSMELHLYEDRDYSSETQSATDCHQQLEKPSLDYALNRDIPVSIKCLDVANELKTRHLRPSVRESMQRWHEDLTYAPSGQVLIDSLLSIHDTAEMQQRKRLCQCRRISRKLHGLSHEYELQCVSCVCNCRCCRLHTQASLSAKMWRCLTGWFDKLVFCRCFCYRTKFVEVVAKDLRREKLPWCCALPLLCCKRLRRMSHPVSPTQTASIRAIQLRGHGIHGRTITAIMSRHIKCNTINLSDCGIGSDRGDIEQLEMVLRERAHAWTRDVGETVNVFQRFKGAGEISKLNLRNNELRDIGGVKLFRAIRDLPIEMLDVSHCDLAHESISELGLLLDTKCALSTNLSRLRIDVASNKYLVKVVTASEQYAGTDANVTIKLIGSVGSAIVESNWLPLDREHQDGGDRLKYTKLFERSQEDNFTLYCDSVGEVQQICIRHDHQGVGADWKLDRVEVWEPGRARHKAVFDCHSWLRAPTEYDDGVQAVLRLTPSIDYSKTNVDKIHPYWNFEPKGHWRPQPSRWQRLHYFDWWPQLKRLVLVHDRSARDRLLTDPLFAEVQQAQSLLLRYETDCEHGARSVVCHADEAFSQIAKLNGSEAKIMKAKHKQNFSLAIDRIVKKWKTRVCEVGMIRFAWFEQGHLDQSTLGRPRSLKMDDEYVYELHSRDLYGDLNRDFSHVRMGPPDVAMISSWLGLQHVDVNEITIRSTGRGSATPDASMPENHSVYCLANRDVWQKEANQRGAGFDLSYKCLGPADVLLVSRFIDKHAPEERVIDVSVDAEFSLSIAGCPIVGASVDLDLRGINHLCRTLMRIKPAELNLSSCGIGPASVAALAHFVKHINVRPGSSRTVQSLRKLILSGNDVTGREPVGITVDADWFRPVVYDCAYRVFSDVHQECMDSEVADWGPWHDLCMAVHDSAIEELIVADAGLGPLGCKTFAQSVNSSTTCIDLSGNLITGSITSVPDGSDVQYDEDVSGLEELQRKMQQTDSSEAASVLSTINFANCFLGPKAVRIVAQMVENLNTASNVGLSLTSIDLSGCQVSTDGSLSERGSTAQVLADAIGDSITLDNLRLDSTGVPGCPRAYSLRADNVCIDLSYTNLGEADLNLVVAWLNRPANHTKAKWASIEGNAISDCDHEETQRAKLQRLVEKCPKLIELRKLEAQQCDRNHRPGLHMSAWHAVEMKLVQLGQLRGRVQMERTDVAHFQRLDLSGCHFAPQGLVRLATILNDASRLQDLSLRGSTLGPGTGMDRQESDAMDGWAALCRAVGSRLRRWDVSGCGLIASSIRALAEEVDWDSARLCSLNLSDNPLSTGKNAGGDEGSPDFSGLKTLLRALGDLHDTTVITEFELMVENRFLTQIGPDVERTCTRFETRHPPGYLIVNPSLDDAAAFFAAELRTPKVPAIVDL